MIHYRWSNSEYSLKPETISLFLPKTPYAMYVTRKENTY